jgi:hypothetical protein
MCPVRWSLKNQRTAQPLPIADILRRVGISVCVVGATWADKAMLFPLAERSAAMTALARIRRWHFLDRYTGELSLIGDELFQLEARPVVTVCTRIRFGGLALAAALADIRQVFKPDARMPPLG